MTVTLASVQIASMASDADALMRKRAPLSDKSRESEVLQSQSYATLSQRWDPGMWLVGAK